MKVFISSTWKDLIDYRAAAIRAVEGTNYHAGKMEVFGARSEEPLEACLKDVEKRMGSCRCSSILGLCIGEPESLQKARELKLFETLCVDAVATASDILEEMLSAED